MPLGSGGKNGRSLFVITLFWFAHYVFVPYFSPYLAALDFSASTIGVIVGTYGLSQLLLRTPIGITADKIRNHKLFMLAGFGALMAAGVLLLAATSPAVFTAARFLSGVSASTWVNFSVSYTGRHTGAAAARAVGQVMACNNLGRVLSFVYGMVLYDVLGISGMFLTSAIAATVGLLVQLTIPRAMDLTGKPMRLGDVPAAVRNKNLLLFSCVCSLQQLVMYATSQSFTANYAKELGAGGTALGLLSLLFSGFSLLVSLALSTRLRGIVSDWALLVGAFASLALYCLAVPRCTTVGALCAAQFLCGLGSATVLTMSMDLSTRTTAPEHKATAMGVYQSIYGIGITLGPVIMGRLLDATGSYTLSFYAIGGLSLAGAVWCALAVKQASGTAAGRPGNLSND